MKYLKLLLLVVLSTIYSKCISKEGVYAHYVNHTTNDSGIYLSPCYWYPCMIDIPASIGDSIEIYVYAFDQGWKPNTWYKFSDTCTVLNFQPSDTIPGTHWLSAVTIVVTENFYVLAANGFRNQYFHFVSTPTGIDENIPEASIELYPMPVNDKLFIKGYFKQSADVAISIYDISGNIFSINNEDVNQGTFTYSKDIENLSDGLYFISITTPTYRTTKKFIKK
ncbi:MAG: T9SS type A sorting domain-containing protein [Bacteroidia bacterium]